MTQKRGLGRGLGALIPGATGSSKPGGATTQRQRGGVLGALGTQEAASRARLTQLIGVSDTLARLRLRRDILADSVRSVSARVEQARIQQDGATSAGSTNVRIVEAPSPPNRRSNPPVLFVAAGVVSGIALAAIALLTKKRWLEWGMFGVAGVGILLGGLAALHI